MVINSIPRQTIQKTKIFEYLKGTDEHPTAIDVYAHVSKELPGITLATVYRNLNAAAEQGDIIRLEIDGEYHYDAMVVDHVHLICDVCKKIKDYEDTNTAKKLSHLCQQHGFDMQRADIMVRGVCKACARQGGNKHVR